MGQWAMDQNILMGPMGDPLPFNPLCIRKLSRQFILFWKD